ncbi:hypothetical protein, partial [Clostridioides difficile]|uniref:hypothetical protein n=1 Tax=Clostridioides difficile TaxID=1496 RepID=UPI001A9A44B6
DGLTDQPRSRQLGAVDMRQILNFYTSLLYINSYILNFYASLLYINSYILNFYTSNLYTFKSHD